MSEAARQSAPGVPTPPATPRPNQAGGADPAARSSSGGGKRSRTTGSSNASKAQLEERFSQNRSRFLDSMEKLYVVARQLKETGEKATSVLPPPAEVGRLTGMADRSYRGLHAARSTLDEREAAAITRNQADLISYLFGGLAPEKMEEARRLMSDGADPATIMSRMSGNAAASTSKASSSPASPPPAQAGAPSQGQAPQGQPAQGQPAQGQPAQGQASLPQSSQGQPAQQKKGLGAMLTGRGGQG